jgi:hypothetical protein
MINKTDLELIPEVMKLRELMRDIKIRNGKLIVEDLPVCVESLRKSIPIYQELKNRECYKITTKYIGTKLELVTEILKNNYGIELREKK